MMNNLENGNILIFPELPFSLLPQEQHLLSPIYADPKAKNISLNHNTKILRCAECSSNDHENLKNMLERFSQFAVNLIQQQLPAYMPAIELARTSFRPVEIHGRVSSYRKDDTRLHVDAFPATPNQGQRILRVFTNINPHGQDRVWRVGDTFENVAKQFLPRVPKYFPSYAKLLKFLKITKSYRTKYDHIMLHIHDQMKADLNYQKTAPQQEMRFAPGTTWIVQTDHVSHAAMSGQHVLEQTFYLPVDAMHNPDLSPLRILEKLKW